MKRQGYNARLDDSMGSRNGAKAQGMGARRNESKGMEKAMGKPAYSGDAMMMMYGGSPKKMKPRVVNYLPVEQVAKFAANVEHCLRRSA